jgi:hypothetical protein
MMPITFVIASRRSSGYLTARTDVVALARMIGEDYEAARPWARYICEELDHDILFFGDLARHGVGEARVLATPLFNATRALIDYLDGNIEKAGSVAAVAYSLFVEWNSIRYSLPAVTKAAETYSSGHVARSLSHAGIDEQENHYEVMVDIAHRLLRDGDLEAVLVRPIREIAALFRSYFEELYHFTLGQTVAA